MVPFVFSATLALALAPNAQAASESGPATDDAPEECVEGIEGGNETICVSGEAPTDPCEDRFGPGWSTTTDPFGNPAGCGCVGFFCDGGGGGGGGGGGDPQPPDGGGGGGEPEDDDKLDKLLECYASCDVGEQSSAYGHCTDNGHPTNDPATCAAESVRNPGSCAGTQELCLEMNVMPDGSAVVPDECKGPAWPVVMTSECRLLVTQCELAWLGAVPPGGGPSLNDQCQSVGNKAASECRKTCIGEVFEGSGCEVSNLDGSSIEGEVQVTGQCCNSDFDCASCASPSQGSQCTIDGGPTQRTEPVKGLADVLAGVLVDEILEVRPTRPVRPDLTAILGGGILATLQGEPAKTDPIKPKVTFSVEDLLALPPVVGDPPLPPSGEPETEPEPGDPGEPQVVEEPSGTEIVALEGTARTKIASLGKLVQGTSFAFRFDQDGTFRGIDEAGVFYDGAWKAKPRSRTSKVSVELEDNAEARSPTFLAKSFDQLGGDPKTLVLTELPRIDVRTDKQGASIARIKVVFQIEVDGSLVRGTYTAKLHEAVHN
jgi:hypothetical protein